MGAVLSDHGKHPRTLACRKTPTGRREKRQDQRKTTRTSAKYQRAAKAMASLETVLRWARLVGERGRVSIRRGDVRHRKRRAIASRRLSARVVHSLLRGRPNAERPEGNNPLNTPKTSGCLQKG